MTDNHLIEMYLSGELTPEQHDQVELRMQSDASFAHKVRFRMDVNNAIQEDDIMNFRNTLESIHV